MNYARQVIEYLDRLPDLARSADGATILMCGPCLEKGRGVPAATVLRGNALCLACAGDERLRWPPGPAGPTMRDRLKDAE
jgi:hypothetical protein